MYSGVLSATYLLPGSLFPGSRQDFSAGNASSPPQYFCHLELTSFFTDGLKKVQKVQKIIVYFFLNGDTNYMLKNVFPLYKINFAAGYIF